MYLAVGGAQVAVKCIAVNRYRKVTTSLYFKVYNNSKDGSQRADTYMGKIMRFYMLKQVLSIVIIMLYSVKFLFFLKDIH
jgi:hypothetical protein